MNIIKKIPIELSSLIFSISLLGSEFASFSKNISSICTLVGFILLIALSIKIFSDIRQFYNYIDDPFVFPLFSTYSFSIMILSMWVNNNINPYLGFVFWSIGVIIYFVLMIAFTYKYVFKFSIGNVNPGWFVMYSGIIIISLTCPLYTSKLIPFSFWFGFIMTTILIPHIYKSIIDNKFLIRRNIIATLAFPVSLTLLGCIYIYQDKLYILSNILIIISQLIYIYVIIRILQMLLMRKKFSFNLSYITFPLLVTGLSLKMQVSVWSNLGQNINFFDTIFKLEISIATIALVYVFIQYVINILKNCNVLK